MKEQVTQGLVIVGLLMLAVGIAMPLLMMGITSDIFRYIFTVGAALLLVGRLFGGFDAGDRRLNRLLRIQVWAAVAFGVAAYFMWADKWNMRDPLAFTLAGALIQLYATFMLSYTAKKLRQ